MPHSLIMKSLTVNVHMKHSAVISSNFLGAQFQLSHFLCRKIIFYTGFFISVIALYQEKKDFVVIVRLLKKE